MESLFPQVFFLSYFVPFILRLALAFTFFSIAQRFWSTRKGLGGMLYVLGAFLFVGLFTQLVAIIGAGVFLALKYIIKIDGKPAVKEALLPVATLLALFILGAGAFAFDLPY